MSSPIHPFGRSSFHRRPSIGWPTRHHELGMVLTELVADRLGKGRTTDSVARGQGFRILRCIGRGGMSVVYRAQDESPANRWRSR